MAHVRCYLRLSGSVGAIFAFVLWKFWMPERIAVGGEFRTRFILPLLSVTKENFSWAFQLSFCVGNSLGDDCNFARHITEAGLQCRSSIQRLEVTGFFGRRHSGKLYQRKWHCCLANHDRAGTEHKASVAPGWIADCWLCLQRVFVSDWLSGPCRRRTRILLSRFEAFAGLAIYRATWAELLSSGTPTLTGPRRLARQGSSLAWL